jgi:DNA-binding transcriptional LysR family regulator
VLILSTNILTPALRSHSSNRHWTYYASHGYAAKHALPDEFSDDMEDHRIHLLGHVPGKRRNVVRYATSNGMMIAIQTGQGIGPFPVMVGDRNPNLIRCFAPPPFSDLPVSLVVSPSAHQRAEVRLLFRQAIYPVVFHFSGVT